MLAPCPGVLRRLSVLHEFASGRMSSHVGPRRLDPTYKTALDLLAASVPSAITALHPWADRPVPVFPCLCDVWHDHVFFTGERVSGVIDYGAMKTDHPAVDLARLLGDLVDGDPDRTRVGLDAYRAADGPVETDPQFVDVLDRTGLVCAVIHWVNRPEMTRPGHPLIAERVNRLIGRLAGL